MRATEISAVVTIPTIRANWSLKCWNKFIGAVKTFHSSKRKSCPDIIIN